MSSPVQLNNLGSRIEYSSRDLKSLNIESFTENLRGNLASIQNFFSSDIDVKICAMNECLQKTIDHDTPVEMQSRKVHKHLVHNTEIQHARRKKRRAERKYKKSRLESDKTRVVTAMKELKDTIQTSTDSFYDAYFSLYEYDSKQTYKMFNRLLYKDSKYVLPTHSNSFDLANRFEQFYEDKITGIQMDIVDNSVTTANENDILDYLNGIPINQTKMLDNFSPMSSDEILVIINDLANKQCDLDPLPAFLFKGSIEASLPYITNIVNTSLEQGCFPDELKKAVVTPILKDHKLDPDVLKNYRPVSNLSIISKILEKCVLKQLLQHLEQNDLMAKLQSAYRKHHSCETALLKIYDDILTVIDSRTNAILVLLDFSSAFDTINQELLLKKLKNDYGIEKTALKWFDSYLNNRHFMVKIKDTHSNGRNVRYGVPQGSILGPILFLLYVKEMEVIAARNGVSYHMFANDSQLYLSYNNETSDKTIKMQCSTMFAGH